MAFDQSTTFSTPTCPRPQSDEITEEASSACSNLTPVLSDSDLGKCGNRITHAGLYNAFGTGAVESTIRQIHFYFLSWQIAVQAADPAAATERPYFRLFCCFQDRLPARIGKDSTLPFSTIPRRCPAAFQPGAKRRRMVNTLCGRSPWVSHKTKGHLRLQEQPRRLAEEKVSDGFIRWFIVLTISSRRLLPRRP